MKKIGKTLLYHFLSYHKLIYGLWYAIDDAIIWTERKEIKKIEMREENDYTFVFSSTFLYVSCTLVLSSYPFSLKFEVAL